MPQMSPFNWLLMFTIFTLAMLTMTSKLFTLNPHLSSNILTESKLTSIYTNKTWSW